MRLEAKVVLAFVFGLLVALALGGRAAEVGIGKSGRAGDFDAFLRVGPVEVEFIDEGRQPDGIRNINRVVNLDLSPEIARVGPWSLRLKAGLTSSRFSYNGSGNGYANNTGFTGSNIGAAIEHMLQGFWKIRAQILRLDYAQSDRSEHERFTFGSLSLIREF